MPDWIVAIWMDVVGHFQTFEIRPPRTLDELVTWGTILAALAAAVRWIFRRIVLRTADAIPLIRVHVKIINAATQLRDLRRSLEYVGKFLRFARTQSGLGLLIFASLGGVLGILAVGAGATIILAVLEINLLLPAGIALVFLGASTLVFEAFIRKLLSDGPRAKFAEVIDNAEIWLTVVKEQTELERILLWMTKRAIREIEEDLPIVRGELAYMERRLGRYASAPSKAKEMDQKP